MAIINCVLALLLVVCVSSVASGPLAQGFLPSTIGAFGVGADTSCTPTHATTNHATSQSDPKTWITTDTLSSKISCTVTVATSPLTTTSSTYDQTIINTATITVDQKGHDPLADHQCATKADDAGNPNLFQLIENSVTVTKSAASSTTAAVTTVTKAHNMFDNVWSCSDFNPASQSSKTLTVKQELNTVLTNSTTTVCGASQVACFNTAANDITVSCVDQHAYCTANPSYECIPATATGAFKESNLRALCGNTPTNPTSTPVPSTTPNAAAFSSMSTTLLAAAALLGFALITV